MDWQTRTILNLVYPYIEDERLAENCLLSKEVSSKICAPHFWINKLKEKFGIDKSVADEYRGNNNYTAYYLHLLNVLKQYISDDSVNINYNKILSDSIENEQYDLAILAINNGAELGSYHHPYLGSQNDKMDYLLANMVAKNEDTFVKFLFNRNKDRYNRFELSILSNDTRQIEEYMGQYNTYIPLFFAIAMENVNLISKLIDTYSENVKIDYPIKSLISLAIMTDNIEVLKLVLENQDINMVLSVGHHNGPFRGLLITPVGFAFINNKPNALRYLINNNQVDMNPLLVRLALMDDKIYMETARVLSDAGYANSIARLKFIDTLGIPLVKLLLDNGVNPDEILRIVYAYEIYVPLGERRNIYKQIVDLLVKSGANIQHARDETNAGTFEYLQHWDIYYHDKEKYVPPRDSYVSISDNMRGFICNGNFGQYRLNQVLSLCQNGISTRPLLFSIFNIYIAINKLQDPIDKKFIIINDELEHYFRDSILKLGKRITRSKFMNIIANNAQRILETEDVVRSITHDEDIIRNIQEQVK